jgi:hypothetical protein
MKLSDVCDNIIAENIRGNFNFDPKIIDEINSFIFGEISESLPFNVMLNVYDSRMGLARDVHFSVKKIFEFKDGRIEEHSESESIPIFLYVAATNKIYSDVDFISKHAAELVEDLSDYSMPEEQREWFFLVLEHMNKHVTEDGKLWLKLNK